MSLLLLAFLALQIAESKAQVLFYTDRAVFEADVASLGRQILDFESETAGTLLSDPTTIGGITFSGYGTPDLIIDNTYEASSGVNYLGINNAGTFNQFSLADGLTLSFASKNAIGLTIITAEVPGVTLFDDDIRINVPGIGIASLDADAVDSVTPGGDRIFFIGLIDGVTSFTMAHLEGSGALGFYNVDDIVTAAIPEPRAALAMLAFTPILIGACWWRRSSKRRPNTRTCNELK